MFNCTITQIEIFVNDILYTNQDFYTCKINKNQEKNSLYMYQSRKVDTKNMLQFYFYVCKNIDTRINTC